MVGEVLSDRYELRGGSFGNLGDVRAVYRAHDRFAGPQGPRSKYLHEHYGADRGPHVEPVSAARHARGRDASSHPNIVAVIDPWASTRAVSSSSFEYVEGRET